MQLFAYDGELLSACEGEAFAFLYAFMLLALVPTAIVLLMSLTCRSRKCVPRTGYFS